MSQSKSGKSRRSSSGTGKQRTAQGGAPRQGTSRQVGRVAQTTQDSSMRANINRALPPFSTKRYIAIWLVGTAVLLTLLLALAGAFRGGGNDNTAASTPVAGDQAFASTPGAIVTQTSEAVDREPGLTGTPETVLTATASTASTPAGGTTEDPSGAGATGTGGKFMTIETDKGRIVLKLHTGPEAGVENTIANFERKAAAGEFNGRVFHRVEPWVVQGGDPLGNGTGGGDMPSEYNQITFARGALGIARGQDPSINNDSQFFIVKNDSSFLDGQYTNWGQVVEGMEVVDRLAIGDKMNTVTIEDR